MSLAQLYEAKFTPQAREALEDVLSWIPDQLTGPTDLKPAEREEFFAEFVKLKQSFISTCLNSMYKVASLQTSSTKLPIEDYVAATTRGTAKADNERWFMKHLHKTRLAANIVGPRLDHLINNYCMFQHPIPLQLDPIRQAIDVALRAKRTDWKQKLRKAYRRTLEKSKLPASEEEFRLQIFEAVNHAFRSEKAEDMDTNFDSLEPSTVEFYKIVAKEYLSASNPSEGVPRFLEAVVDPTDNELEEDEATAEEEGNGAKTNGETKRTGSSQRSNTASGSSMDVTETSSTATNSANHTKKRPHEESESSLRDERESKKSKTRTTTSKSK